MDICVDTSI